MMIANHVDECFHGAGNSGLAASFANTIAGQSSLKEAKMEVLVLAVQQHPPNVPYADLCPTIFARLARLLRHCREGFVLKLSWSDGMIG
jgi:hypothetical protein